MFRLLIPCLIWLSSVRSETGMPVHMPESAMMMQNDAVTEAWMLKMKRHQYHNPCPPAVHSHVPAYSPPPIYVKPYMPPVYTKNDVNVHPAPPQYGHAPSYVPVVHKPAVTYVKPVQPQVIVKPTYMPPVQSKLIYPMYQKPMLSYASIYQKPIYYAPMYQKPMYEMPKFYLKKYEPPVTQVVYQKPQPMSYQPIHYQPPKVVHVQPPQVNYVKIAQPVIHPPPVYHPAPMVKPHCP